MSEDATGDDGWVRLLDGMKRMAEELTSEGWETLAIPAGDAAPVTAEGGRTDDHGFAYVIPGDDADTFDAWFTPDGFTRAEVHRAVDDRHLHLLTTFLDAETSRAILIAAVLDRSAIGACRREAFDAGVTYSHVFRIDGTHLGSFRHDDPEPFFPDG